MVSDQIDHSLDANGKEALMNVGKQLLFGVLIGMAISLLGSGIYC